jgi:hypothetical protein
MWLSWRIAVSHQLSAISKVNVVSLTADGFRYFPSFETKNLSTQKSVTIKHQQGTKVTKRGKAKVVGGVFDPTHSNRRNEWGTLPPGAMQNPPTEKSAG